MIDHETMHGNFYLFSLWKRAALKLCMLYYYFCGKVHLQLASSGYLYESTCGWMVRRTVVSPAHQSKSHGARIYPGLISVFSGDVRSVGGDVPLDYEAPMVTS